MVNVADWSATPAQNTLVNGINIGEGCPPGNLNDGERAIMAGVRSFYDDMLTRLAGIDATVDPTLAAIGGLTTAADTLPYFTGPDTAALTAITPFARSILAAASASAAASVLGAMRVDSLSLGSPGYLKIQVGAGQFFMVAWGGFTANPNSSTSITYAAPFPTASFCVCTGGNASTGQQDNGPFIASSNASGATAYSSIDSAVSAMYIAVGY